MRIAAIVISILAIAQALPGQTPRPRLPRRLAGHALGSRASATAGWDARQCSRDPHDPDTINCPVPDRNHSATYLYVRNDTIVGVGVYSRIPKREGQVAQGVWDDSLRARYERQYGTPDSVRAFVVSPVPDPRVTVWWHSATDHLAVTLAILATSAGTFGTSIEEVRTASFGDEAATAHAVGPCALVASGDGSHFDQDEIDNLWYQVDTTVAAGLFRRLSAAGYSVRSYAIPRRTAPGAVPGIVGAALAGSKCNRLVKVTHRVGVDDGGSFFAFDVNVFGVVPESTTAAGGTAVRLTDGGFQRTYRFARSQEVMQTFRPVEFGGRIKDDLLAAGALPRP